MLSYWDVLLRPLAIWALLGRGSLLADLGRLRIRQKPSYMSTPTACFFDIVFIIAQFLRIFLNAFELRIFHNIFFYIAGPENRYPKGGGRVLLEVIFFSRSAHRTLFLWKRGIYLSTRIQSPKPNVSVGSILWSNCANWPFLKMCIIAQNYVPLFLKIVYLLLDKIIFLDALFP